MPRFFRFLFICGILLAIAGSVTAGIVIRHFDRDLPDYQQLAHYQQHGHQQGGNRPNRDPVQLAIEVAVGSGQASGDISPKCHRQDQIDGGPDPGAKPITGHVGGAGLGKAEAPGANCHPEQAQQDHAGSGNGGAG